MNMYEEAIKTQVLRSRPEGRSAQLRQVLRYLAIILTACLSLTAQRRSEQTSKAGIYSLPRSQDDTAELDLARKEIKQGSYDRAVTRLDRLLQDGYPGVVPVLQGIGVYQGLRFAVIQTLRDLPADGRKAYERLMHREGGHLLKRPIGELRSDQLHELALRFPTSAAGFTARLRLGDLALEAGDAINAQHHFLAARDSQHSNSEQLASLRERQRIAAFLEQDARGRMPASSGALGDALRPITTGVPSQTWPEFGGGYDGTSTMADPIGRPTLLHELQITAAGFDAKNNLFPMHATGDLNGIYINNGIRIYAINPLKTNSASALQWFADGPMIDAPDVLESVMGAINRDMILSPAVSDNIVVAALHVPKVVIGAHDNQLYQSINVIRKIASRRLFAFDRSTGKRLWAHWDGENGSVTERFAGHDAAAPPLIHGDTVYVASHDLTGAISYYLTAYDLNTGTPRWRRLMCSSQQEVNMFGNARQEFAAAPLAIHGGVIYGTTNLGVCYAVNAEQGTIRWIKSYEVIPLPQTQMRGQHERQVFFANNPTIVKNDVMVCTPLDSAYALGIDTRDGSLLWRLSYDGPGRANITIRWLLGVLGDEVLFSGTGVVAVKLRPKNPSARTVRARVIRTPETLNEETTWYVNDIPRGALTASSIYFIGRTGSLVTFNGRGDAAPNFQDIKVSRPGNLLLSDGILITVMDGFIGIYGDLDALIGRARREVSAKADDPAAILRLVSLLAASPQSSGHKGTHLETLLTRGLAAAKAQGLGRGSRIYRKLASRLFEHKFVRASRTAKLSKPRGLRELAKAREYAVSSEDWQKAQLAILSLSESESARYLTELEVLAEQLGHLHLSFPGLGRMPVTAYVHWKSIPHLPPESAVLRCQELKDRFGDVYLGKTKAALYADKTLEALVATHGREIYRALEAAASELLRLAGDNAAELRAVSSQYPHSKAASKATARLLDAAVAAGNLHAASRSFGDAILRGPPPAGVLRRMLEASAKRGNTALALALAERLRRDHAGTSSDYTADQGKNYAAVTAKYQRIAPLPAPAAQLPEDTLAELQLPNNSATLDYVHCQLIPQYEAAPDQPIYTQFDDHELRVYDSLTLPTDFEVTLFRMRIRNGSGLLLMACGETLLVCEPTRVRAVHYRTGELLWDKTPSENRNFEPLGVSSGVLLLFSTLYQIHGDGGRLLGIEPITGALLYEKIYHSKRQSVAPIASGDSLYTIDTTADYPTINQWDALTGHKTHAVPVNETALDALGLSRVSKHRISEPALNQHLFATAAAIYLGYNNRSSNTAPKLIALNRKGDILWTWNGGHPNCILALEATYGEYIVILEKGRNHSSHITVLDSNGHELRSKVLGKNARCLNWSNRNRQTPVPKVLFISSLRNKTPTLLCYALEAGQRSFELELPGAAALIKRPILSDTFIAVPTRGKRLAVRMHVIDLKTRRGALANGERIRALKSENTLRLWQHGPHIIASDSESLLILGNKAK